MKSPQSIRLQNKKSKLREAKPANDPKYYEENLLNAHENEEIIGKLRSIVSRILLLQEDENLLKTNNLRPDTGKNTHIAQLIQSQELRSSITTLKHFIEKSKPTRLQSEPNNKTDDYMLDYSKNHNKSYCEDVKDTECKAIIYKDVCITGERINLWKRIKSGIISTVADLKAKKGPGSSEVRIDSKTNDLKDKKNTSLCTTQQNPFSRPFWNMNCENVLVKKNSQVKAYNSKNSKSSIKDMKRLNSLSGTGQCITVPLLKFTDISTASLCSSKSISKCSSDEVRNVTCSTSCHNRTKKAKGFRVKITKSSKIIIVKSTYSLKNKTNVIKEKWTRACNRNKVCKTVSSACNTSTKCAVKTSGMQTNCKKATCKAQTQHSKIPCKDKNSCTSRNVQRKRDSKTSQGITVQKRCVSTQGIIEIGCGDQIHNTLRGKHKCGALPNVKENMYNQIKKIICKCHNPTSKSMPNRKLTCSSNNIILCNKKVQHKCSPKKENVKKCICIGTQCNFLKTSSSHKCSKQPLISISCKKASCQKVNSVGIQCTLLVPNTCQTKKKNRCPNSSKKSVCKTPRLMTVGTQYKKKCSRTKLSKCARKLHNLKQNKKCLKCKLPTRMSSSIQTIFPIPADRTCKCKECATKKSSKIKTRCMLIPALNTTDTKVTKPKLCTCTKKLLASKSSEKCCRRKVPMLVSSSMETLYPQGCGKCKCKQHPRKRKCSIFSFRTPKQRPCRCVTSLIYFNRNKGYAKTGSMYKINCNQPAFYPAICDRSNVCCKYGRGDFLCRNSQHLFHRQQCRQYQTEKKDKCFQKGDKKPCSLTSCNIKKCRICSNNVSFKWPIYPYSCWGDYKPWCLSQSYSSPCQNYYSCLKPSQICKSIPHLPFVTCKRKKRCTRFNCFVKKVLKPFYSAISSRRCGRKCKRRKIRKPSYDYKCDKIYMKTVRRGRCKFIYKFCPWMHPECMHFVHSCKQNLHLFFIAVTCVAWCPVILILELLRVCCCYFCCD